jgi:hypothetical protein
MHFQGKHSFMDGDLQLRLRSDRLLFAVIQFSED